LRGLKNFFEMGWCSMDVKGLGKKLANIIQEGKGWKTITNSQIETLYEIARRVKEGSVRDLYDVLLSFRDHIEEQQKLKINMKHRMTPGVLGERLGEAVINGYVPEDVLQNLEEVVKKALNGYSTDLGIVLGSIRDYLVENENFLQEFIRRQNRLYLIERAVYEERKERERYKQEEC